MCAGVLASFCGIAFARSQSAAPPDAERVLMEGHVDDAIRMLHEEVAENSGDGQAHLLLCRAYFSEAVIGPAVAECESAVRLMPRNSSAQDWMGRAYGMKANGAGPLAGLKLAYKVRNAFQAAFSLDPHSANAANDLAEYYVDAPALVGGGTDKADDLADRVGGYAPQVAHRIHALSAEKRGDYSTAEREFSAATSVKNAPEAWVDLGGFYVRRKETDRAVAALQHAAAVDNLHDAALVDVASYLMDMKVRPDLAKKLLQQYLAGNSQSDAAPVIHVHVMLSTLLKDGGDMSGARDELKEALRLAVNYSPAQRALLALR